MNRRLGLIIGVNQYQDTAFRPLQFAENDARAFAQWLVNTKGGQWQPADVQHLQGEHTTRELVESLITQLCLHVAGPGDIVLIYFAGQAFVDERSGDGYLALTNTHYQEPATGLHLLSMARHVLSNTHASQIIFIFDCFQSGQLWSTRRASPTDFRPLLGLTLINALQQQDNGLFFCSCRGNELLPEVGERGLGLFMYQAILGLCGSASPSTPGNVTLQQLYAYLATMLGEQQQPQIFGQGRNPVLLVGDMPSIVTPQQISPAARPVGVVPAGYAANTSGQQNQFATQAAYAPVAIVQLSPQQRPSAAPAAQSSSMLQQQSRELLDQAHAMIKAQNHIGALNTIEQVLQIAPDDISALILKGQLLGTIGRMQDALAVVEYVLHLDANNALAWSMHAVLLTNMGQHQAALADIEHALELDTSNLEAYSIKTNIMGNLAVAQTRGKIPTLDRSAGNEKPSENGRAFLLAAVMQLVGLGLGIGGSLLAFLTVPTIVAEVLESLGLAVMCVNAAVGAYRYGATRLVLALLFSIILGGGLGAALLLGYKKIIVQLGVHQTLLVPALLSASWLALAALLPLVLAVVGFVVGIVRRR